MTVGTDYFDELYATSPDPWGMRSRWYETRKYAISLALLPWERYGDAFEAGCSIGVFTRLLAPRCDRLLACDGAAAAAASAAARNAALPQVRVEQLLLPGEWPPGQFDLIVFSEFLYYFAGDDLNLVLERGTAALRPGGTLLAVHWRHPVDGYPRTGDNVHEALAARPELARLVRHTEPDFLAEVYIAADGVPVSVAQATGLV